MGGRDLRCRGFMDRSRAGSRAGSRELAFIIVGIVVCFHASLLPVAHCQHRPLHFIFKLRFMGKKYH